MNYLILVLYLFVSILHLIASFHDDSKRRAKTKPFLLILLLLFYLVSTDDISIPLALALFASWLGDVLLIPKGHHWFIAGGIAFIFSHLFFIMVYLTRVDLNRIPWMIVIPVGVLYYGIALCIILAVQKTTPKQMVVPMYFYLLCNSTMNVFALMQWLFTKSTGAQIAYIGALLFYISDCTLFLVRYYKHPEIIYKKHFTVMLTYLLGELLIVIGVLMLKG